MSALQSRLPKTHEATGDQILPLRFWDTNEIYPKIALDFTLRFDDVIDPHKLRSSLERLLEIGNWHQMGARYKKNGIGKLEFHIPTHYDESRPGFAWTHDDRPQSIYDDQLGSRLPRSARASHPTVYEAAGTFEKLVTHPDRPKKMADWTATDRPPLAVHVVSFTDATIVTLTWSHVYFDALGRQSLLQAWQAVLEGREEDVPTFVPYEDDPIVSIAESADPRDHIFYDSVLTGIWFVLFVISFIYEVVVHSKEAGRIICFPGSWVNELRGRAMDELLAKGIPEKEAFLSHGDVLLAFWCKTTMAAQKLRPSQALHIINAMNIRGVSEELPVPGKTAYIGNAVTGSLTLITIAEIDRMSVAELANRIREDLNKQKDPKQVRSMAAWVLENFKKGARQPITGSWSQLIFSWSNWSRAKFFDVDFSSAVTKAGPQTEERTTKVGRPSFAMTHGHADGISVRNGGPLIGPDANGDWWVNWVMRAEAWPEVERVLSKA